MITTRAAATTTLVLAAALALGGCGGGTQDPEPEEPAATAEDPDAPDERTEEEAPDASDDDADDADDPDDDADAAPGPAGATATIVLRLDGGPDDGTHEAQAPDAGCSRNPMGDNTFGLQYSTGGSDGFSSLQVIVDDAQAAASSGTDAAVATATVNGNRHNIARGSGLATVQDDGDTAVIVVAGTTDDGLPMTAQIECHTVLDL